MEAKKPGTVPVIDTNQPDEADRTGVRRAWAEVKRGISDAAADVKAGIHGASDHASERGARGDVAPPPPVSGPYPHEVAGAPFATKESIAKLNECLRGELSAVETYELALTKEKDPELSGALRQLRDSHARRVTMLRDRIRSLGAEPSDTSGAWGALAKLVQRGADLFGDRTAISALEEGEDHGLQLYSADLDDCDMSTREFIVVELLPEQQRSHDLCRSLDRFVRAA